MKSMRAVAIGIITIGALACATLIVAQQQNARPRNPLMRVQAVETSRDSRMIGISVVRTIVTAEVTYNLEDGGSFVGWDQLYAAPDMQKYWEQLHLHLGPEVVPGWKLNLVASADGKHFTLSLRNLPDKCGFSFFSDDHGIIYQGGWIDCSVELKPAS